MNNIQICFILVTCTRTPHCTHKILAKHTVASSTHTGQCSSTHTGFCSSTYMLYMVCVICAMYIICYIYILGLTCYMVLHYIYIHAILYMSYDKYVIWYIYVIYYVFMLYMLFIYVIQPVAFYLKPLDEIMYWSHAFVFQTRISHIDLRWHYWWVTSARLYLTSWSPRKGCMCKPPANASGRIRLASMLPIKQTTPFKFRQHYHCYQSWGLERHASLHRGLCSRTLESVPWH